MLRVLAVRIHGMRRQGVQTGRCLSGRAGVVRVASRGCMLVRIAARPFVVVRLLANGEGVRWRKHG